MSEIYLVGMFGRFEWTEKLETRVNNQSYKTTRPILVEGAIIKKVNHKTFTIKDMMGISYLVPIDKAVYTPMDPKKPTVKI